MFILEQHILRQTGNSQADDLHLLTHNQTHCSYPCDQPTHPASYNIGEKDTLNTSALADRCTING